MTLRRLAGTLGVTILLSGTLALFSSPALAEASQLNVPVPDAPVGGVNDTVDDVASGAGDAASDVIGETADKVGNTVADAGKKTGDAVSDTGSQVGDAVGGPVGDAVKDVTGAVGDAVKETSGNVGSTVSQTGNAVGKTVSETTGVIGGGVDGILDGVTTGADGKTSSGKPKVGKNGEVGSGSTSHVSANSSAASAATGASGLFAEANRIDRVELGSDRILPVGDVAAPIDFGRSLAETARTIAFPLALTLLVVAFVLAQGRFDRKDPKLALAAMDQDEEMLRFS